MPEPANLAVLGRSMSDPYTSLDLPAFATYVGLLGSKVAWMDGLPWLNVRPGFYRPLHPFRTLPTGFKQVPFLGRWGGAQWPVASEAEANSHLNYLVFSRADGYSSQLLDKKRRWQLRQSQAALLVRPFADVGQFTREAHPVYLSFQDRTGYAVGQHRRDPLFFTTWAEGVFRLAGVRVLGAWQEEKLIAVSITYRLDETVFYATYFCNGAGLKAFASDLMLHTVRAAAALSPGVSQVYAGGFKNNPGLDDFYLLRGAEMTALPARLKINPILEPGLRIFAAKQLERLRGRAA